MPMNFVVFTWNFLPDDDAEAYCTARFANALAEQGHSVHVVTPRRLPVVNDRVCSQILTAPVRFTTFASPVFGNSFFKHVIDSVCMTLWLPYLYREAVKTLKSVLKNTESPVLISRSLPAQSYLVAYKCRKYASCWIAHFSDPWPWHSFGSRMKNIIVSTLIKRQVRKVISRANGVSVTCHQVLPFFERTYGATYKRNIRKFFVVPHIGEPVLEPDGTLPELSKITTPIVSHCGVMNSLRYCDEVINAIQALQALSLDFEFIQVGHIDPSADRILRAQGMTFRQVECRNPSLATQVYRLSKICLVLDTRTAYGTSLFLPSKFVYLLFSDTPIVVYTPKGSAMEMLAEEYPEAGIVWAEAEKHDSLSDAIALILRKGCHVERSRIRRVFHVRQL